MRPHERLSHRHSLSLHASVPCSFPPADKFHHRDVWWPPMSVVWWAAFGHRDFKLFQGARLFAVLGSQMQSVAIGWQIYAITGRPLDLAWVGLAQFLPAVCLSLVTGNVADRVDRKRILMACYGAMSALAVALFVIARSAGGSVTLVYAVLVGVG